MYFVPSPDGVHGSAAVSWREGKKTCHEYLYLGTVLDRERGIFQNDERGVYTFSFPCGDIGTPPDDFTVPETPGAGGFPRRSFDFGDAFLLNAFLHRTGLMDVVDTLLPCAGCRDTLHALVLFYSLSRLANDHADAWFQGSAARLLYPHASLDGRRISELLDKLGQPEAVKAFHEAHLHFVLTRCSPDKSVLVDSTAVPNSVDIPLTQLCSHGGDACDQLRLIMVAQKKSGYPMFYRAVSGNTPDMVTLRHIVDHLSGMGVDITACIVDGDYYTFSNIDMFYNDRHQLKIPFITRVKSNYKEFKKLVEENLATIRDEKNIVRYGARAAYIIKKKVYVGKNKDNPAYMYLGLDLLREEDELEKYLRRNAGKELDPSELHEFLSSRGLFCLLSGDDLPCSRILPGYCQRQAVEQLFDCLKNYTKIQPIRNWKESTVQGHMLLSYVACCASRLMQSRLEATGLPFGPRLELMRVQKCTRYRKRIVVDIPQKPARETYEALGIDCPGSIPLAGAGLRYAPPAAEPPLGGGSGHAGGSAAPVQNGGGAGDAGSAGRQKREPVPAEQEKAMPRRRPGRPKGSRNRKTLEREAEYRARAGLEPKRGRGRPKGSKNKKIEVKNTTPPEEEAVQNQATV